VEILMNASNLIKNEIPSIIAVSPQFRLAPHIAIAASRAGALGVLDLGIRTPPADMAAAVAEVVRGSNQATNWGLRFDLLQARYDILNNLTGDVGLERRAPVLQLAGVRPADLRAAARTGRKIAHVVLLEARDLAEAHAAQDAGFDGVVLKGNEAGGYVCRRSAFMLTQECAGKLAIPYWIQGGIGPHTAAAVVLAGARGVVIGEQLWQTAEAPCPPANITWSGIDGSETALIGSEDTPYRCFSRSGRVRQRDIDQAVARGEEWQGALLNGLLDAGDPIIPAGADIGLAEPLGTRFGTVGRIVTAIRDAIGNRLRQANTLQALQADGPLARSHGTRFPIVQGPMTRVSDVAPFARDVAAAGALPFVALAVLRGPEVATLLCRTRELMGAMPWGVGMLGFVPRELRDEQLRVLREIKPPFAIIAGGRPSQARELEALGVRAITTSCGFLVRYQHDLQAALAVPVWTSSLLQVPELRSSLSERERVGIVTVDATSLGAAHLRAAGAGPDTPIEGLEPGCAFQRALLDDLPDFDIEAAEAATVAAAQNLVRRRPDVAAIVLECTNMPPYADAVRRATGRPVHDIATLLRERFSPGGRSP